MSTSLLKLTLTTAHFQSQYWDLRSAPELKSWTKEKPTRFALWKRAKENEPSCLALGPGRRVGILSAALWAKVFRETLDIHGAGSFFPHHEMSSTKRSSLNTPFVRTWMHMVCTLAQEKWANHGNLVTIRSLLSESGEVIDIFNYSHYRSPVEFSRQLCQIAVPLEASILF